MKKIINLCFYIFPVFLIIYFFTCISNTKSINIVDSSTFDILYNGRFISDVGTFTSDNSDFNEPIDKFLKEYLSTRNSCFLTGDVDNLCGYFNKSSSLSKHALIYDFKRIAYLRDWSNERGIVFTNITTKETINNIVSKDNYLFVTFQEESTFSYNYLNNDTTNSFTTVITHNMKLDDQENKYTIIKDYYQDCFKNSLSKYKFKGNEKSLSLSSAKCFDINFKPILESTPLSVTYADKYFNVLNPIYPVSMNFQGNAANFVSQCLGDIDEGNALPQDNEWNPFEKSWMDNTFLKEYLIYSDRGRVLYSGTFSDIYSNLHNIQLGDVVSYSKGDLVVFTAIVTGFDSNGYPLVNSNSINRYKVPFDLGWSDKNIHISFIRIIR